LLIDYINPSKSIFSWR